jgi:hypothetical protein
MIDRSYDVELPRELDDEDLDKLAHGREPSDRGSVRLAAFVCRIRLAQITSNALSSLYAIGKGRTKWAADPIEHERLILVELSSALNMWEASVPEKLRYDPNIQDPMTLLDSSIIHLHHQIAQVRVPMHAARDSYRGSYNARLLLHTVDYHSPALYDRSETCTEYGHPCAHHLCEFGPNHRRHAKQPPPQVAPHREGHRMRLRGFLCRLHPPY